MDSLKLKSLMLSNFGGFEQVSVSLNDNVTYLIGGNGSGKSTVGLTGLWFVMQGIASKATKEVKTPLIAERFRFIGQGGANTTGTIVLHDEKTNMDIEVTRKMTKSGQTLEIKAPEGVTLTQDWLNDIFDPYMIAPAQFYNLSSKEQALALGIDTEAYDKAIEQKKQNLSTEVAIGKRTDEAIRNIALTPDEIAKYTEKKDSVTLSQKLQKAQAAKDRATFRQSRMIAVSESIERSETEIERIKAAYVQALKAERGKIKELQAESNSLMEEDSEYQIMQEQDPASFDVELISKEISELDKHNDKVKDVESYSQRVKEQADQQEKIDNARLAVKDAETARVNYLKNSNKLPFDNMSVNDKGELLLNEKPLRPPYFSTGELIKYTTIILSETRNSPFKYVFLQDFSLMDEDKQADVIESLIEKDFQIVVEVVEKRPEARPNAIILTGETVINGES